MISGGKLSVQLVSKRHSLLKAICGNELFFSGKRVQLGSSHLNCEIGYWELVSNEGALSIHFLQ